MNCVNCVVQFILRGEVLRLYREIMKTLRHMPNETDRRELMSWARQDFRKNMHETDEVMNHFTYMLSSHFVKDHVGYSTRLSVWRFLIQIILFLLLLG